MLEHDEGAGKPADCYVRLICLRACEVDKIRNCVWKKWLKHQPMTQRAAKYHWKRRYPVGLEKIYVSTLAVSVGVVLYGRAVSLLWYMLVISEDAERTNFLILGRTLYTF